MKSDEAEPTDLSNFGPDSHRERVYILVRFILFPPILLGIVMLVVGFILGGLLGEIFAGCLWMLLMIHAMEYLEPVLDWYDRLWDSKTSQ